MDGSDGLSLYAKSRATYREFSVSTCFTVELSDLRPERLLVDARTPDIGCPQKTVIGDLYLAIDTSHLCQWV